MPEEIHYRCMYCNQLFATKEDMLKCEQKELDWRQFWTELNPNTVILYKDRYCTKLYTFIRTELSEPTRYYYQLKVYFKNCNDTAICQPARERGFTVDNFRVATEEDIKSYRKLVKLRIIKEYKKEIAKLEGRFWEKYNF